MTQLHLGDFQPVFLAAAAEEQISTRAAAPHTLPSCLGVAEGLGAAPLQAQRETAGKRKLSSGWSHSAIGLITSEKGNCTDAQLPP